MATKRFKTTEFVYPNGKKAFRVQGTLDGKMIRKNFKSRKDANDYRDKLDIQFLNSQSEGQTVWTTLTHKQNRDAIAAISLLQKKDSSKTLTFAVSYLLDHYSEASEEINVESAVQKYLDERSLDFENQLISRRQFSSIEIEMKKFKTHFLGKRVSELQSSELKDYLSASSLSEHKSPSFKTWNNRRGYLSTFFKFCLVNKFISTNPVLELQKYKVKNARGTAATLSTSMVHKFMLWLESYKGQQNPGGSWWGVPGCLVPYFALTIFGGIRPDYVDGEISKLELKDLRFDTDVILIEPSVSKVNEKRTIKMQPNLKAWLQRYPINKYPIIPKRMTHLMTDIRRHWTLPHDVMRHTFISMTVGAFRSVGDASLQAGNSEAIIRKHYLDLKSVEEADAFWGIVPNGVTLPPMEKKDGRYVPVAQ
jgi:integrase